MLAQQFNQNKFSPRTYHRKQRELEVWVTKEREEVKKTKKAFEQEWEKTAKIINSTSKDTAQVKQILSSARSSQRPDVMANSARTAGLSSFRIESNRKSHRVDESKLIDMIYERNGGDKLPTSSNQHDSSEQSGHQKKNDLTHSEGASSHMNSHSAYHTEDPLDGEDDQIPDFNQVVVFNKTQKPAPAADSRNRSRSDADDDLLNTQVELTLPGSKPHQHLDLPETHTLNRVSSSMDLKDAE